MSVKMAGQTINDRLLAARHSLAGQGLAKSVCKATTEEMIGPKKKHLDYLIHCTNEPNVSIPQLANLLIERSQNTNWVVVFKALITVHHMMCYGNERFTQYLASSNSTFQLSNFLDKSGVQGARVGYDMSPFIRRYAKYLNEKALSYRTVAFDFCKMKRGKEDGTLRTMNTEKLLKTLPVLQSQLDALLEFDCTANDLTNGVINMSFMLLFRDLIRLFACYNDGTINLLEKYFDMNKKQCRDALDLYKKFLIRMDRVAEFLKVAENVGIDKGDIPDLTKAPSSLLDALEQHLASLEGKKGSAANTPTQTASNRTNVKSAVSALSSTSSAFGTAAANARLDVHTNGIDESLKQQVLAEEEAAMNQYKAKVSSPTSANAASTNPFLSSTAQQPQQQQQAIVDLFGSPPATATEPTSVKASADLLQLSANPFADIFAEQGQPAAATVQATTGSDMWMSNGFSSAPPASNSFVSDQNFSSVFGATNSNASATAGMPAPNPFMSDFAPTTGSQAAEPPSSAVFDGQAGGQAEQQDFFGQGTDLFGDMVGGGSEMLQPMGDHSKGEGKDAELGQAFSGLMQPMIAGGSPSQVTGVGKESTPPPPRPPPPSVGATSRTGSPVATSDSPVHQSPAAGNSSKSAFEDLNESIRAALGGSPTRPPASSAPLGMVTMGGLTNFDMQGPGPIGGGGVVFGQPMGAATSYGSPGKQGLGMAAGAVVPQAPGTELAGSKVLTGDLDSSLASLAENLTINKGGQAAVKGVQWNSPKNVAKPGMAGWTPQPMAATTGAGYRPMGQGMASMNSVPQYPPMAAMGMQPIPTMRPIGQAAPMMAAPGMMAAGGGGMMGSPRMVPAPMMVPQQPNIVPQVSQAQAINSQPLDPFGAL